MEGKKMKDRKVAYNNAATRREFLVDACKSTLAVSCLGAGRAEETPAPKKQFPKGKYVDIHVHLGQVWNSRGVLDPKMLLEWMDANDISQAVVLPLISPESYFYPITPHWVLEQTKPHRDRLIPFCSVDPRSVNLGGYKGFLDILKRYRDAGAKGFGEHKWGGAMDDARNISMFKACAELKLPVLFHMDNLRNKDKPGLPGLEKVLKEVPNGVFIGHAQGWWSSISGDVTARNFGSFPKGPVKPSGAMDRLMDTYPNIYGDLSAGSGANAIRRDLRFGREFLIRRADRLMFGTDYLARKQHVPQFKLYDSLNLPEEVQAKVFRDNARKLLGLNPA